MNTTVLNAINEQINSEFEASYAYLAMASFCEQQRFLGAAKWLRMQSDEERMHALKLFDFALARDGAVDLKTIDQPKASFDSLAEVFEQALAHEKRVTQQINALYELCFQEKAFAEMTELQWFLTEQVEEGEDRARNRGEIPAGQKRSGGDPRPRSRAGEPHQHRRPWPLSRSSNCTPPPSSSAARASSTG
jgi:ferritin